MNSPSILDAPKKFSILLAKKILQRISDGPFYKLRKFPRYTSGETKLFGRPFIIADAPSFFFMYNEIFHKKIYAFKTDAKKPYILDCGANIGLSVIFFKRLYPKAEIIAFEPDQRIGDILQKNLSSFEYADVKIIRKALWNKETELSFFSEGADGSRIAATGDTPNQKVQTIRLLPYLNREVDFLKIDIEGAETNVLEDCGEKLMNVKNLFVEYHSFTMEPQTLNRLLEVLNKNGFRYYIHHIGILSAQPFINTETYAEMDMQLNIYACRF